MSKKIGEKIIEGKIVSFDNEKIEKLEEMSLDLKQKEELIKGKIDTMIK